MPSRRPLWLRARNRLAFALLVLRVQQPEKRQFPDWRFRGAAMGEDANREIGVPRKIEERACGGGWCCGRQVEFVALVTFTGSDARSTICVDDETGIAMGERDR